MSDRDLAFLSTKMVKRHYRKDEIVFHKEDPGSTLYIIEQGRVRIYVLSVKGEEVVLAILSSGDFFGELSLLDGRPRSATAQTLEESQMLVLDRHDFVSFLQEHPQAAITMLGILSGRLRQTDGLVEDVVFLDVPARLAKRLLELKEGQADKDEPLRVTQSQLASLVGATRESINKAIKLYESRGVLRVARGSITILRPEELLKRVY